ncbi:hypothetical protein HYC85_022972 [Camellia sinensis]|uniref:RRM domain-containing protein n=1 Tax=Camellia sinensis TaxID=4442 RepID=A0A7J7GD45_CAMSI|nr:hypothetical protein HYC85_022972 [Camellia sinensis]
MAALEAPFSIFSSYPPSFSKFPYSPNPSQSIRLHISTSIPTLFLKFHRYPLLPLLSINPTPKSTSFEVSCSAVQEIAADENPDPQTQQQNQNQNQRRKLFVLNLPWSFSVDDIKIFFAECGTVSDVEIIKHKDGKNRGFAFVTMGSGEEAQAVIDKVVARDGVAGWQWLVAMASGEQMLDERGRLVAVKGKRQRELLGRILKVEFAKRFKKPSRPPPLVAPPAGETRHKLYVSNLAWKVRSNHLREFFAANFNPVSARVVFDSPSGKSGGYGFVSFATKEEADAAISALDEKMKRETMTFLRNSADEEEEEKIPKQSVQS